ncbi:unnamed protein product [Arctogadus glacialis]
MKKRTPIKKARLFTPSPLAAAAAAAGDDEEDDEDDDEEDAAAEETKKTRNTSARDRDEKKPSGAREQTPVDGLPGVRERGGKQGHFGVGKRQALLSSAIGREEKEAGQEGWSPGWRMTR